MKKFLNKLKTAIVKIFKAIGKTFSKFADDIFAISGIILLSVGTFKIYQPAGYITLGGLLIALAIFIAKKR